MQLLPGLCHLSVQLKTWKGFESNSNQTELIQIKQAPSYYINLNKIYAYNFGQRIGERADDF